MSSQINTNGIDVNYPIPGTNNSTQGFRDNFAQIKGQFNTAATEITDLQNKAVLKAALDNTVLNNDMGNALISNASTSGWRATTYNLGNALAGTVVVDVNKADVQYGAITGNVVLQLGGWAPTNTSSNVVLRLTYANANASIQLPSACVSSNNNYGVTLLENYEENNGFAILTQPANAEILEYRFSSLDCGNTITVEPINRPYQTTQVVSRNIPPTGVPGDVLGDVAVDANYLYVCTGTFDSTAKEKAVNNTYSSGNVVQLSNTTDLVADAPIIFTGNVDTANTNLVANEVYYIKTIGSGGNITISDVRVAGTAGTEFAVGSKTGPNICVSTTYVGGTDIWKRVALTTW